MLIVSTTVRLEVVFDERVQVICFGGGGGGVPHSELFKIRLYELVCAQHHSLLYK